jgi:hypothetical protein
MSIPQRGSKDLIYDPFYEVLRKEQNWDFLPGQLYWAHVVYPETYPIVLKLISYDPINEKKTLFAMRYYNPGDERHYPVKELNLREGELLYVLKGKKRLVIVLARVESEWYKIENRDECFLCAPVFSFKEHHSQEMVIRTQALLYPSQFYLPPDTNGCPNESAVRFELVQPVIRNSLDPFWCSAQKQQPVRISSEVYWVLLCHFLKFLNGKILDERTAEYMNFYSEYLMDEFREINPPKAE